MTSFRVIFSSQSHHQIANLYSFTAEQSGTDRAESFVGRVVETCFSLSSLPERGLPAEHIRPNLRIISLDRRVTIAYSTDEISSLVVIQGIFYGGQNFTRMLRGPSNDD